MTLTFLNVRIGQLGVEASSAAIDGKAKGPFGGIGQPFDYEDLFSSALLGGSGSAVPWAGKRLHANRFWRKYATRFLARISQERWPTEAWKRLVPIKVLAPLPHIHLHPGDCRSYAEAFVWPTGFGVSWNNWIEASLGTADIVDILGRLHNGEVECSRPEGIAGKCNMKGLYQETLDHVGGSLWACPPQGIRSKLITVVTIVQGVADPMTADAAAEALDALLEGIRKVWGSEPVPAPGDLRAESRQTVFVADGLRLAWVPDSFLDQGQVHRCGCLHRNLLAATLQVEMLAATAELLAEARPKGGSLPPVYAPFAERVTERIDFFLSERGYSAPFLRAQLERGPVRAARQSLAQP